MGVDCLVDLASDMTGGFMSGCICGVFILGNAILYSIGVGV